MARSRPAGAPDLPDIGARMDILLTLFLPLSLAVIMLSLGVGLSLRDFRRVAQRPRAFALGAGLQILFVPVTAYALIRVFGLTGELAAGVMLLSFCPGGVTSNILSRLARGDVALSVALTALISLCSIVTVPLLMGWTVRHFMGDAAPQVSALGLGLSMFLITAVPVALGMILRARAPHFSERIEPLLMRLSTGLFVLIILGALASNWAVFMANLGSLGPALLILAASLMLWGYTGGLLLRLRTAECKTLALEVGLQNGTLGIALAPLIAGTAAGLPVLGLPSAIYGILMYALALPLVLVLRRI